LTDVTPIGWIGLGAMGLPMATRLAASGYALAVWARRPIDDRVRHGLGRPEVLATPADLARACPLVFTIVGGPADVAEIYLRPDGLVEGAGSRSVLVDLTTSGPAVARTIAAAAADRGARVLDAPVSGGPVRAADGTLAMMVGGDPVALEEVRSVVSLLASQIALHGHVGTGQSAKLANQVLVAATMLGLADAWALGHAAGLNPEALGSTLRAGIAGSMLAEWAWGRAAAADRSPGFAVRHLIKDLELASSELGGESADQSLVALALTRYRAIAADGGAEEGTQSLLLCRGSPERE
jgi:3-hydroxyisobutyrate dehydrogenase